jgi:hypothetical protein
MAAMVDDACEGGTGGRRHGQLSRDADRLLLQEDGGCRMWQTRRSSTRPCGRMRDLDEGGRTMSRVCAKICQGQIKEAGAGGACTGGRVHLRTAEAR